LFISLLFFFYYNVYLKCKTYISNGLNREIERYKMIVKELNNDKEVLEDKIDKFEIAEINDVRY